MRLCPSFLDSLTGLLIPVQPPPSSTQIVTQTHTHRAIEQESELGSRKPPAWGLLHDSLALQPWYRPILTSVGIISSSVNGGNTISPPSLIAQRMRSNIQGKGFL